MPGDARRSLEQIRVEPAKRQYMARWRLFAEASILAPCMRRRKAIPPGPTWTAW